MPRTLPWLANKAKVNSTTKKTMTSVEKQAKTTTAETAKSVKATNDKPLDIETIMAEYATFALENGIILTYFSTYIDGFYGDDQWRMVEDEFLFTAQEFTKSIHKAELERLQKQAKNRPKAIYRNLDSLLAAAPVARKKRKVTRRRSVSLDAATDDEMLKDDDAFKRTKLGSLMASPRRISRNLAELTGVGAASKVGAENASDNNSRFLFKKEQSPQASMSVQTGDTTDDSDSEDDDLDAPARRSSVPEYKPDTTSKGFPVDQDETTEDDDDDLDTSALKTSSPIVQTITTTKPSRTAPSSTKALLHRHHKNPKSIPFSLNLPTTQPSRSSASKAQVSVDFTPDDFDDFYNDLLSSNIKRERP